VTRFQQAVALGTFVIVVVILAGGLGNFVERRAQNTIMAQGEAIRDEVRVIRSQLEDCLEGLEQAQERFDDQDARTRRLREEVAVYEGLDTLGVPADRYSAYLEVFDEYNESIPAWERRARILENTSQACRELALAHNQRAETLGRFLVEHGIWQEEWLPSALEPVEVDSASGHHPDSLPPEPDSP
jgi:hypothetical protein